MAKRKSSTTKPADAGTDEAAIRRLADDLFITTDRKDWAGRPAALRRR
jgi:hypothetical protein